MATRSHIAKQNADGTFSYIYCHWDGYPDHVGKILKESYTSEGKVDQLLALGDLSSLGAEIGEKQDFDNRETHNDNWCLAYGRDRGEQGTDARRVLNESNIFGDFIEYTYLFKNGEWVCYDYSGSEINF